MRYEQASGVEKRHGRRGKLTVTLLNEYRKASCEAAERAVAALQALLQPEDMTLMHKGSGLSEWWQGNH